MTELVAGQPSRGSQASRRQRNCLRRMARQMGTRGVPVNIPTKLSSAAADEQINVMEHILRLLDPEQRQVSYED